MFSFCFFPFLNIFRLSFLPSLFLFVSFSISLFFSLFSFFLSFAALFLFVLVSLLKFLCFYLIITDLFSFLLFYLIYLCYLFLITSLSCQCKGLTSFCVVKTLTPAAWPTMLMQVNYLEGENVRHSLALFYVTIIMVFLADIIVVITSIVEIHDFTSL